MREDNPSLPFWQGFRVSDLRVGANCIDIDLEPDPAEPLRCGGCDQACAQVHEHVRRRVRDLPMLGLATRLNVHLQRLAQHQRVDLRLGGFHRFAQAIG